MEANNVIYNSVTELEPTVLAAIADDRCVPGRRIPTVYPMGPVLTFTPSVEKLHECVRWLNAQPLASVVLLCFMSMGGFASPQVRGMANGLERSRHCFLLWVLRALSEAGSLHPTNANLDELLPKGFLERTKDQGCVWSTTTPQKEILAHATVGGFVTHGGWNSVLESLWFGVPMVPWPLYAEQHFNAFTLVTDMGVALDMRVDRKNNNFVEATELERTVKTLMGGGKEGRTAREKAMEMKAACRKAMED